MAVLGVLWDGDGDPPGFVPSSWQGVAIGAAPDRVRFRWMVDPTIGRVSWVPVYVFRGSVWALFHVSPAACLGRGGFADLTDMYRFDPLVPNLLIADRVPLDLVSDDMEHPECEHLVCDECSDSCSVEHNTATFVDAYHGHEHDETVHVLCNACLVFCPICDAPAVPDRETCPNCYGFTFTCDSCVRTTHDDDGFSIRGGDYYVCRPCYLDHFFHCSECGDSYPNSESSDVDTCVNCYDGSDDDTYDGRDESVVIHAYSYKPSPVFYGDGPLWFGLEIETERADSDHRISEIAPIVADRLGGFAYLKHDGSLESGFEIVTHPGTLDHFRNLVPLRDALADLRSHGWRSWNTSTCGFHIHVSRSGFVSRAHLFAFALFFYRNRDEIARFSGRRPAALDRWASLNDHAVGSRSYTRLIDKITGDDHGARYTAVNLANRDTVEIRVFRGTLDPVSVIGSIELLHALVRFTGRLTSSDVRAGRLTWSEFVRATDPADYPALFTTITRRGFSCVS